MFLGEGKQAHDHQGHQDESGYEVLHHGYHSTELAHCVAGDRAAGDDEHRGRSRQRAAGPIEPGRPKGARRGMTPSSPARRGRARQGGRPPTALNDGFTPPGSPAQCASPWRHTNQRRSCRTAARKNNGAGPSTCRFPPIPFVLHSERRIGDQAWKIPDIAG
jgi:hypothetical protein